MKVLESFVMGGIGGMLVLFAIAISDDSHPVPATLYRLLDGIRILIGPALVPFTS